MNIVVEELITYTDTNFNKVYKSEDGYIALLITMVAGGGGGGNNYDNIGPAGGGGSGGCISNLPIILSDYGVGKITNAIVGRGGKPGNDGTDTTLVIELNDEVYTIKCGGGKAGSIPHGGEGGSVYVPDIILNNSLVAFTSARGGNSAITGYGGRGAGGYRSFRSGSDTNNPGADGGGEGGIGYGNNAIVKYSSKTIGSGYGAGGGGAGIKGGSGGYGGDGIIIIRAIKDNTVRRKRY